jgi:hypothetical protein
MNAYTLPAPMHGEAFGQYLYRCLRLVDAEHRVISAAAAQRFAAEREAFEMFKRLALTTPAAQEGGAA